MGTDRTQRQPSSLTHPRTLLVVYVLVALAPLFLAWMQDLPRRPFLDELSSALAAVGFAMLLMEFVISGRFEGISGQLGIDRAIRFHKLTARVLTVFLLIHPYLYTLPTATNYPWDVSGQLSLAMTGWPLIAGLVAWVGLPVLVLWAIFRREFPYRYETWRACHGVGALVIALLALWHTVGAGRYSAQGPLFWFWVAMVGIATLTLLQVYLWRPLAQCRRGYRVVSVEPIAYRTWELVVEPEQGEALEFEAGQFVWLKIAETPFGLTEHPFSMSSCPAERPRIGFAIKEAGDFTDTIGSITPGARAYLDGPHGNLCLGGRPAEGVVFIAGGVGLAPVMSILRQMKRDGDTRPCVLIYGNRVAEQIMYPDELDDLAETLNLQVHHVLAEPAEGFGGPVGQLDHPTLARLLGDAGSTGWLHIVCGPEPMIESTETSLQRLGVPRARILSERFT